MCISSATLPTLPSRARSQASAAPVTTQRGLRRSFQTPAHPPRRAPSIVHHISLEVHPASAGKRACPLQQQLTRGVASAMYERQQTFDVLIVQLLLPFLSQSFLTKQRCNSPEGHAPCIELAAILPQLDLLCHQDGVGGNEVLVARGARERARQTIEHLAQPLLNINLSQRAEFQHQAELKHASLPTCRWRCSACLPSLERARSSLALRLDISASSAACTWRYSSHDHYCARRSSIPLLTYQLEAKRPREKHGVEHRLERDLPKWDRSGRSSGQRIWSLTGRC